METRQRHIDRDDGLTGHHSCSTLRKVTPPMLPPAALKDDPSNGRVVSNNHGRQQGIDLTHIDDVAVDVDRPAVGAPISPMSNDAPASDKAAEDGFRSVGEDARSATEESLASAVQRNKTAEYEKVGENEICRLQKFWLYEAANRFYVVGGDVMERKFRLLKIDRTTDNGHLGITDDSIMYGKMVMNRLLNAMDEANKASGGLKLVYSFWGLLGFIRFTGAYYMLLATKRSAVAVIGGHYVYQIDGTELVPLTDSSTRPKLDRDPEEARSIGVFKNLDLTQSFYFSYSYNITRTLQHNILRERQALGKGQTDNAARDYNSMFIWNHHLLKPAAIDLRTTYDWCIPIIHGFVDQASTQGYVLRDLRLLTFRAEISNYGRSIYITIIARRSRFFAGARFLKRGANDLVSHTCSMTIEPRLTPRER